MATPSKGKRKRWTKENEQFLRANCGKIAIHELAKILNVTLSSVRTKSFKLGLHLIVTLKKWTKQEDLFLVQNFSFLTCSQIGKKLNRSERSVLHRCTKLNLFKFNQRSPFFVGEKCFRLTVISKTERTNKSRATYYLFQCECSNFIETIGSSVRAGNTKSCGCLKIEKAKTVGKHTRGLPGEASLNHLENTCKKGAESRSKNIPYELTTEQFRYLISLNCYWDGTPPRDFNVYLRADGSVSPSTGVNKTTGGIERQWIKANGIDRLNSDLGYTIDNCVPCCFPCNQRKMDSPPEEFLEHMQKILDYQANKVNKNVAS